jgi:hypothetical protein
MEGLMQPLLITTTLDDSIATCIPTPTRQIVTKVVAVTFKVETNVGITCMYFSNRHIVGRPIK